MTKRLSLITGCALLLVFLPLAFLLTSFIATASPDIAIQPPNPTENDSIEITVSGVWGSACIPEYASHHRTNNTIQIEAKGAPSDVMCIQIMTDWAFTVHIGRLRPGKYTVLVVIDGESYDMATFDVTELTPSPTPTGTVTSIPAVTITDTPPPTRTATRFPTATPTRIPTWTPIRIPTSTPMPGPAPTLEPPAAPSNLNCQTLSSREIRLTWHDNSDDEFEFRIELRVQDSETWQEAIAVPANTTSVSVRPLWPETTYSFRVRGYRPTDPMFSAYTNVASCTTMAATHTPTPLPLTLTSPPPVLPTTSSTSSPIIVVPTASPLLSSTRGDVIPGPVATVRGSPGPGSLRREQAGLPGPAILVFGLMLFGALILGVVVIASRRLPSVPIVRGREAPTARQARDLRPGALPTRLGQFQLVEPIGSGGMSMVYRAYQPSLKRYVALKVLAPHLTWDANFVQRFHQEATTAATLDHPNIVPIYDVGEQAGFHYIAMKYINGRSMKDILAQEGPMKLDRVLRIALQVAEALDYAHRGGVIHRDIKPGNILVGPGDHVTLTDFGIAKILAWGTLTSAGTVIGTPEYMSPEQAKGERVDPRTDIYSLGIVMYEMVTGQVPFAGENPLAVLHQQVYQTPPQPRQLNPSISEDVQAVILRALEKMPAKRFSNALEMVGALVSAADRGQ